MNGIKFPTYREMYPEISQQKTLKRVRSLFRFYLQTAYTKKQIDQLIDYLNHNPHWIMIFRQNPYRFNALLAKFCDARFNKQQRVNVIIDNFRIAQQNIAVTNWENLIQQRSLLLANLTDDITLNLNINDIDPFEGFFSINIQNSNKERLYDASFCLLENSSLLIASIQGPKGELAQDRVKQLTKTLHGIRPMFMLVIGFKLIAKCWNLNLNGIPHKAQAKYRFNDSSRLLFNYDIFWQENSAIYQNGYWQIPLDIERKHLDEIASKKRSMYRKRYEMLDSLEQQISNFMLRGC